MSSIRTLAALAIPALLAGGPVLAQQTTTGTMTATTVVPPANVPAGKAVVPEGRLEMTHGGWRSSKIVGASVFNDQNNTIGTIEDLIVDKDGKISDAVISVGGFLGIGTKLVAVPFDQLRFENQVENRTTAMAPATTGAGLAAPPAAGTATAPAAVAANPAISTAPATVPPAQPTGMQATAPAVGTAVPATGMAGAANAPAVAYEQTRIVLPGATKQSLKSEQEFKYQT